MTTQPTQLSTVCPWCGGTGYFISGVMLGGDLIPEKVPCPDCKGRGAIITWEAWGARTARKWTLPSKRQT